MKKILCRADGNSDTGLGHLYRMFALYEMYKDQFDIEFITRDTSTKEVIPNTYNITCIPDSISIINEPDWLVNNYTPENDILIADGYQFTSDYQLKIKTLGFNLLYVDDLASERMFADVVINHSPYVKEQDFSATKNTKFALGTKYAVLRPGFLHQASLEREINKIENVFVCFGGADAHDFSLLATKALLELEIKEIHIVLGGAYKHKEILEVQKVFPQKVFLYKNLSEKELIKKMKRCHLAIAPSSTICYELCCVKMPILSGYFVKNQELIYKGFVEEKVIYPGGNFMGYTKEKFKKSVMKILREENFNRYIENQSRLFDSNIKSRFLNLIN